MLFSFFWGELGKLRRTNKYRVTRPHRVQAADEKTQRRSAELVFVFKAISLGFGVATPGETTNATTSFSITGLSGGAFRSSPPSALNGQATGSRAAGPLRIIASMKLISSLPTSFLRKSGTWFPFPPSSGTRVCASFPTREARAAWKSTVTHSTSSNSPHFKRWRPCRTCCEAKVGLSASIRLKAVS